MRGCGFLSPLASACVHNSSNLGVSTCEGGPDHNYICSGLGTHTSTREIYGDAGKKTLLITRRQLITGGGLPLFALLPLQRSLAC